MRNGFNRSRHRVGGYFKAARTVAIVIGAGLFLLCACARQELPTATPTHAPPPTRTRTAVPIHTPPPLPTATSLPSPPPSTDLAIQISGSVQVVPGETTVYTLTLRNRGPAPATGIVLTDVLPPGLIPLWTQPTHPVCRRQERSVSCDAGDFRESDAITVTLDLSVGGTDTPITGTQVAGVSWDLSRPACAIHQGATPPYITCRLASLQPGANTHVRFGVGVDAGTTGALVHTASVVANEADTDRSNNHATSTMTVGAKGPVLSEAEGPVLSEAEGPVLSEAEGPVLSEPVADIPAPTTTDLVLQADGPASVIAGQPFTYAFTITNRGALDATGVSFENVLPPATVLHAYAPGLPRCQQRDDTLTCTLRDPESGETVTFTLVISGHAGQPMIMEPDPLMPGWPICTVLKERTYLYIVNCELGVLRPGQTTHVQLGLIARGVQERAMVNAASVSANEAERDPLDNTDATTITVRVRADLLVRSTVSGPAIAGETLSYTLSAVNLGPSDADVVLTDRLPMGTRLISATSGRGDDCRAEREEPTTDTIICNLGRLNGGETATVTVVVELDESLALVEEISHSARVVTEQADPDASNNELTQIIPISAEVGD